MRTQQTSRIIILYWQIKMLIFFANHVHILTAHGLLNFDVLYFDRFQLEPMTPLLTSKGCKTKQPNRFFKRYK